MDEIDKINSQLVTRNPKFRILKGIEVDIKADGSLDLDKKVLEKLDVVVGAVHSKFNTPEEEMTKRVLKAIETGVVNIIAHPTGRLLSSREPYPINMAKVMEAAKRHKVIMELNSYPDRLDLNDIHCKLAKGDGCDGSNINRLAQQAAYGKYEIRCLHSKARLAGEGGCHKHKVT